MFTDYCHNYAETVRMIMTIVGFSLHQVCDGNSRKVYNTCHTQTLQKINMSLFGKLPDAIMSTQKTQLAHTNRDCGSFSSLYICCLLTPPYSFHNMCTSETLLRWTHNQRRRVRAGEVCDPGESEWEAKAWKTKYIIQQSFHEM